MGVKVQFPDLVNAAVMARCGGRIKYRQVRWQQIPLYAPRNNVAQVGYILQNDFH